MTRSHFMKDLNIVSISELTSISNFLLTNFKDLNYSLASRFFWANSILSVTSSHFWADFWLCFGTPFCPFVPLCLVSHPLWSPTGAHYFDNTSQKEKEDDIVQPNNEHVYYWEVTSDVSPQPDDPTCLTYTYISHQNVVEDYNSGLIGTLLICKPGENRDLMTFGRMRRYVEVYNSYVSMFSDSLVLPVLLFHRKPGHGRKADGTPAWICLSLWGVWREGE